MAAVTPPGGTPAGLTGPDGARPLDPAAAADRFLRPGTLQLGALPPLSLYVHLPWCLRKCPYCDFNSHEAVRTGRTIAIGHEGAPSGGAVTSSGSLDPALEQRYLDALMADLEASLPLVWGRRVHTVFIGGGTPSLFSPEAIDRLLAGVRARLPLEAGCEVTLEANPGTFEAERFRAFRGAGVTRLSIGVQSFDDAALQRIGRVHDGRQARAAVEEAASAFDTFNLDLMYALPGQTLDALRTDLATALSFAPPHLSVYHLTLEPNTFFAKHPPTLPDDDTASDMLDLLVEQTAASGLQRYEVSAFAKPGHRCAHNLNYWHFGDYLGIGAGAHGKLSFPHRVLRQTKWREPAAYMTQALQGAAVSSEEEVTRRALPFEYMLNALRLREGFDLTDYTARTGLPMSSVAAALDEAERRGLIDRLAPPEGEAASPSLSSSPAAEALPGRWVRPTPRGFDFLSDLQTLFLAS